MKAVNHINFRNATILACFAVGILFAGCNREKVYVAGYYSISNRVLDNGYAPELWQNGVTQNFSFPSPSGAKAYSVFVSGDDVYVAGYADKGSHNRGYFTTIATLWKNGKYHTLANQHYSSVANSVYVSGSDVYVVGYECKGDINEYASNKSIATLWKNGVPQYLTDGTKYAEAYSVYVSDNNVYVAGHDGEIATLWKNGVAQNLTDGSQGARAKSVYVSGSDVYIVGFECKGHFNDYYMSNNGIAIFWKNGVAQNLTDGSHRACANSVYVHGNDVYVVGYVDIGEKYKYYDEKPRLYSIAILWKNGVSQYLTDGTNDAEASSIYVSDNNVYVAGYENIDLWHPVARLWKNGEIEKLSSEEGKAYCVFVKIDRSNRKD